MGRPCQECLDEGVLGCQCSLGGSDSVGVTGSGSPGDPFVPASNLDPDAGNQAEVTGSGLLVATFPYVYAYADNDQNRADAEPIAFDANDPHTPGTTMHDPVGSPDKYNFNILEDGWYVLYVQCLVRDTNPLTDLNLYWEDEGGAGSRYTQGYVASTPCVVSSYGEGWFTSGTVLQVRIRFTGAGPADVQGGTRYRTFAVLRKVAKV